MNNIMVSDNIKIENMIYEIRGKKVMLTLIWQCCMVVRMELNHLI